MTRPHSPLLATAVGTLLLAGCVGGGARPSGDVAPAPPATRTVDVVDDYHGTRVPDPYRWLEDLGSAEVRAWAGAQNAVAERRLASPLRARLAARMRELAEPWSRLEAEDTAVATTGLQVSLVPAPAGTHRVLGVRHGDGEVTVLADPRRLGAAMEITRFDVSPGERYVAYAVSDAGSEWTQVRVVRVADGRELPDVLADMLWTTPVWTHDGEGFFYVRYQRSAPDARTTFHSPAVHYHRVGTPQAGDAALFRTPAGTTHLAVEVQLTPDGRYLLVREGEGAHVDGIGWLRSRPWLLDLRNPLAPDLSGPLRPLAPDRNAAHELVGQRDSLLYLLTDRGAPRRRLVAVNAHDPAPERWRDVIPESTLVLDRVQDVRGRWAALYLDGMQHRLRVLDRDGHPVGRVALPPLTTVLQLRPGPGEDELDLATMSLLRPPGVTRHDLSSGASRAVRASSVPFDTTAFVGRQLWYRAKDGTRVPMLVMHRRDLALDGSHPTMLFGYGASSQLVMPAYGEPALAWLELGGVVAAPALRGGGQFGRAWYEAAILDRKQVTFDDFIAAAEWLIAEGYTSPARLAIQGGSFGGLLVAAVTTQRPELFAAAVAEVPAVDVLRFDFGRHRAQIGDARDPAQFPFLHAYAPLQHVRSGTCYPATLVTAAMNDDRAPAWEAFKLTAALQSAQSCARPVLLRVHDAGGHLGSRGPDAWLDDQAEALAFVAHRLGMHP